MNKLPPEKNMKALLELMDIVLHAIRDVSLMDINCEKEKIQRRFDYIFRATDMIHNIPHFITNWDQWDEQHFIDGFLKPFDINMKKSGKDKIVDIYQDLLTKHE